VRFERGHFSAVAWQQWTEWFTRECNWYNFSLIEISFEDDVACGGYELQLSLIGLCVRLGYYPRIGPQLQIALDRKAEIEAERAESRT
jgi:hypothetical protein